MDPEKTQLLAELVEVQRRHAVVVRWHSILQSNPQPHEHDEQLCCTLRSICQFGDTCQWARAMSHVNIPPDSMISKTKRKTPVSTIRDKLRTWRRRIDSSLTLVYDDLHLVERRFAGRVGIGPAKGRPIAQLEILVLAAKICIAPTERNAGWKRRGIGIGPNANNAPLPPLPTKRALYARVENDNDEDDDDTLGRRGRGGDFGIDIGDGDGGDGRISEDVMNMIRMTREEIDSIGKKSYRHQQVVDRKEVRNGQRDGECSAFSFASGGDSSDNTHSITQQQQQQDLSASSDFRNSQHHNHNSSPIVHKKLNGGSSSSSSMLTTDKKGVSNSAVIGNNNINNNNNNNSNNSNNNHAGITMRGIGLRFGTSPNMNFDDNYDITVSTVSECQSCVSPAAVDVNKSEIETREYETPIQLGTGARATNSTSMRTTVVKEKEEEEEEEEGRDEGQEAENWIAKKKEDDGQDLIETDNDENEDDDEDDNDDNDEDDNNEDDDDDHHHVVPIDCGCCFASKERHSLHSLSGLCQLWWQYARAVCPLQDTTASPE